jgi:hypothetical protein
MPGLWTSQVCRLVWPLWVVIDLRYSSTYERNYCLKSAIGLARESTMTPTTPTTSRRPIVVRLKEEDYGLTMVVAWTLRLHLLRGG